jgi:hypothetical protein
MAKKNMLGLAKLDKKKIRRKGRHSKKHKKAKFSRGQGKAYLTEYANANKSCICLRNQKLLEKK